MIDSAPYRELLLGCGHARTKVLKPLGGAHDHWAALTTVDSNAECKPDIVADLDAWAWPDIPRDAFDEVHAYEILEHLGRQGDAVSFFNTFYLIWRVLKPGGVLFASTPAPASPWLWGDPGHVRAILPQSLVFLDRAEYAQLGRTSMSDYRSLWNGDFVIRGSAVRGDTHLFQLEAVKPVREYPRVGKSE